MSVQERAAKVALEELGARLVNVAARAGELDRNPRFPRENFAELRSAGALAPQAGGLADEVRLVRAVAGADASTARILDGHLNGVERLILNASEPLLSRELGQIREGELLLGVWGADPGPGEGVPAHLEHRDGQSILRGVKTFCSGAGGVQRALVLAAEHDGKRRLVYLDTTDSGVSIDRGWYDASGLRASESHRVKFCDTPVLAVLGAPGELSREPYFSRDAIRSCAIWVGLCDAIMREAIAALDVELGDAVQLHTLGRMRVAHSTIERWLEHTARVLCWPEDDGRAGIDPAVLSVECRVALYGAAQLISSEAARICGSRALIGASALDRDRRDLDLFLLQHRLDAKLSKLGAHTLKTQST